MVELTNEQRACFGLAPVEDGWQRIAVKPSPYDHFDAVAWVDGHTLRKVMHLGDEEFMETDVCEQLSEDHAFLLPKTDRGKPFKLSSSTLAKRPSTGMTLSWQRGYITLHCETNQREWYSNSCAAAEPRTLSDFIRWVDAWCAETTDADLAALHLDENGFEPQTKSKTASNCRMRSFSAVVNTNFKQECLTERARYFILAKLSGGRRSQRYVDQNLTGSRNEATPGRNRWCAD